MIIIEWAQKFIKLFMPIIKTEMKYPKLHNWCYHIVDSIQDFGAINGFTTETYEYLHKEFVKSPYRMSNRRDAKLQMLNSVRLFNTINNF